MSMKLIQNGYRVCFPFYDYITEEPIWVFVQRKDYKITIFEINAVEIIFLHRICEKENNFSSDSVVI